MAFLNHPLTLLSHLDIIKLSQYGIFLIYFLFVKEVLSCSFLQSAANMNAIIYQVKSFNKHFAILVKKEKHNRFFVFCDFVYSMIRFGASASDYFDLEFYNKTASLKKQFVCWKLKRKFMKIVNDYDLEKADIFGNKVLFFKYFHKYIGRDWIDTATCSYEDFCAFVKKHPSFLIKPYNLSQGKGIRRESVDVNTQDLPALFEEYKKEKIILEEFIVQHSEVNRLYPKSVNTARIAALNDHGNLIIIGSCLRCGGCNSMVDNFSSGGFAAAIDPETGVIVSDGCNLHHDKVIKHPDTNVLFHGFKIPYWQEAIEMIKEVSQMVEGTNYIGWDVAFTEKGPVLVEGNYEGMFHAIQQADGKGLKQKLLKIIDDFVAKEK